MYSGQSINFREDCYNNNDQYGFFIKSTKRFLRNQSIPFLSSWKIFVNQLGPFWPTEYPIKYPTLLHLSRTSKKTNSKEYYHFLETNNNRQTYDNQPAISKYKDILKHPVIVYDMDRSLRNQLIKQCDNDQQCPQLIFESRFEGGNLRQVRRVGQFEYELVLRTDLYTRRHTQWYYFRAQNMIANVTYRFRIINLMKKSSLYNDGMQILLFSEVDAKRECRSWYRVGHHISYSEYKQRTHNPLLERDINYYELDFQFEFPHSGDTCYIAHCYPYTFTDLKDDLEYLSTIRPREIFRRDILCESQAGNSCFIITVTDESVPLHKKKFVILTARIHPGETNSSYMMRGLLEFITSNDKIAQKLRSELVFKIVPMMNPDGVIVGNYRCSLTGKDMNRNFRHPRKQTFPIIYHIRELIQNLQRQRREILVFCDLHGHSRKSNVFAYGCDGCDGPQPDMKKFLYARVLPFIMSRTAPDMFAFDYCKFHVHRCKESTGRVVMWKEMLIKNSFTLEASFAGSSILEKPCHFNIQDYEKFGESICKSLKQYLDVLYDSTRLESIFMDITKTVLLRLDRHRIPRQLLSYLYPDEQKNDEFTVSMDSVSNCLEILTQFHETINEQDDSSSSDSDSDPEGGELSDVAYPKERQTVKKKSKKKRSDKPIEEISQKLNRKRQTKRSKSIKSSFKLAKDEFNNQNQTRVSYPFTSDIDINSQLKLTLATDQMDQTVQMLPERGTLFKSKYARRNGHGLPIFTTERALERKYQKRSDSALQNANNDQQPIDEYDTNIRNTGVFFIKSHCSQIDTPTINNQNINVKQVTSHVPSPRNELSHLSCDQIMNNSRTSPSTTVQNSSQKRLQNTHRFQQQTNNKFLNRFEFDQTNNISPAIITMPNLMEFTRRLSCSSSIHDNDMTTMDTQINTTNKFSSVPKHETPILHRKMFIVTPNKNLQRTFSQKINNCLVKQPKTSLDYFIKERSISNLQENNNHTQLNTTESFTQNLKKQFYIPFEKNKRS
ncbi:unnamed protein product [Rotaria socialis]